MSSINLIYGFVKLKCPHMRLPSNVFFLTESTLIIVKTDVKPIRSKGHSSNPLKKMCLILKLPSSSFSLFSHEILKFKYFAIKNCVKLL